MQCKSRRHKSNEATSLNLSFADLHLPCPNACFQLAGVAFLAALAHVIESRAAMRGCNRQPLPSACSRLLFQKEGPLLPSASSFVLCARVITCCHTWASLVCYVQGGLTDSSASPFLASWYACLHVCLRVCLRVSVSLCLYACMYVCLYVCLCV